MKRFLIFCMCLVLALSAAASAAGIQPYTISLYEGTPVYTGPGTDYDTALIIDEDGVFTIVEEAIGTNYKSWGKLKSGAGWVQLTFRAHEMPYTLALPAGTTVYSAPGYDCGIALTIDEDGVFTIEEESFDTAGNQWGKLKSGAGWVQLNLTSYTLSLNAGTTIYDGPGRNFGIAQTLGEDGVFTIVEEAWDDEGGTWGKLKSGAGWVQLNAPSYMISLSTGTAIHEGPGYNFDIAQTLSEDGVFTIIEEAWDDEGALWGKLKSGAGWVFLKAEWMLSVAPIRAFYAEDVKLQREPVRIIADTTEYAVDIVFLPNEDIRNVVFTSMVLTDYDFAADELLFTADELTAATPLLASVSFPGDMTTYGLAFTDASGSFRRYTISISGMDGSLELTEQY